MDYDVIQMLRPKTNKSQYVCRSVRAYTIAEEEFDVSDVSTRQLMAVLYAREDIPRHIKIILYDQLNANES